TEDNKVYENKIKGEETVTFPHKLSSIDIAVKPEAFRTTPFANTYTFDFAKTAIENESLGKNSVTDFLAISISATDYIGHSFGPNSVEIEDTYLRLDKDIADFLQYLDAKMGKGNYTVFLSADHAVAHIPSFLAEHKIPAGVFDDADIRLELNRMIDSNFGVKNMVQSLQNYQVYLNTDELERRGKDVTAVKEAIIKTLQKKPFILTAFETGKLALTNLPEPQKKMFANAYNIKRSGDIQFTLKPGYFDGWNKGTTHGLWNPYDAHIPLLFFGWGVKPGKLHRETYMTDISPTLAAMLKIQMPSGSVGKVIEEVIK
ncbi:MAG TPA: alkaline phosphatase family protein, partial [Ferruginibacter sp.]|nr:alkaline phosphatase family protein [Ferruginibacter sp.]